MWQWWDGAAWKALEPGDEAAGNKAWGRKASGPVFLGLMGLVAVALVVGAVLQNVG